MIGKLFLLVSFILVLILCVRILKATSGTSILAWHALFLVLVFDTDAFFIREILYAGFPSLVMPFGAFYDDTIADRIVVSLVLVNLVALVFLFALWTRTARAPLIPKTFEYRFSDNTPVFFYLGCIVVAIGFVSYVNSPMGRIIIDYGPETLGDYNAYYEVRYEASVAGMPQGQTHLHHFAITTTLPLLALYSMQRYILRRERQWLGWWIALTIAWIAAAILLFAKSFIINVVLTTTIGVILTLRSLPGRRTLSALGAIVGSIVVFVIANLVYQVLGASEDLWTSAVLLVERFLAVPITTTWNHFVVFPDLFPHTYYGGSRALNLLLAAGQTPSSRELTPYQIASAILTGRSYNMNTGFVGSGWAELGYLGVVQAGFVIFGVLLLWDIYLQKKRPVVPLAGLVAFFLGKIWNIHNGDLMFMLIAGGVFFAPLVYLALFHQELLDSLGARRRRRYESRLLSKTTGLS